MADNTILNTGAGGDTIASDDIAGVKHQRVKVEFGGDGTATEVEASSPLPVHLYVPDSALVDAFGRLRVSNPHLVFDAKMKYDKQPLHWDEALAGGASAATHVPNRSSVTLDLGTTSGDKVTRQTKRYFKYQPGKSFLVVNTVVFDQQNNNVQRVGLFDDENGVFFQMNASGVMQTVVRSYVTGSAVDDAVNQTGWNIDALDGSGPSGVTADWSKVQILVIDLQWLGAGRVRFGVDVGGMLYYVHEENHANINTSVYMTTADLPLRYESENTGTAAGATAFEQICSAILSEGGMQPTGEVRGYMMPGGTARTFNDIETPVLSIRLASDRIRTTVRIVEAQAQVITNSPTIYRILLNPTVSDSVAPSWVAADAFSAVEIDRTRQGTVSGGVCIAGGQISSDQDAHSVAIRSELTLAADIAGTSDEIVMTFQRANGTAGESAVAALFWTEND